MIARTNVSQLRDALADRYRIEGELGQGGMATVYLAEDLKHKRSVAVKVLHAEHSAAVGKERFLREITTAANLTHPHIVPVFDSGEAGGQLYFVMPLIEGETLRARIEREGPLSVEEAIRLVREVADGLEYAHGAGVLHRDLKPENIMLSRGHAVLADFGIAGSTDGTSEQNRLTQTGTSLGTAAYMSPEQATGERELGPPSDVYGLASVRAVPDVRPGWGAPADPEGGQPGLHDWRCAVAGGAGDRDTIDGFGYHGGTGVRHPVVAGRALAHG
jgi:eukaryotic-like serine/threonine-protein kinase